MPGDEKSKQAETPRLQNERLAGANMRVAHECDVGPHLLIFCVFEVVLDSGDELSGHAGLISSFPGAVGLFDVILKIPFQALGDHRVQALGRFFL